MDEFFKINYKVYAIILQYNNYIKKKIDTYFRGKIVIKTKDFILGEY
ncbi:hypothetical protein CNEONATC25_01898 [Clostridium neonatale]|uniref:Uncharacterized protein n=1 Tax=Clostridium neonatale TaxID=137838 RepID=A0A650M9X9_9CLOT|nr:hypothetical protein CNEO_240076 [Clostridium neonatale]CAG9708390.1 conserved hypothetical protein [Clostridium neonatale]CAI3538937.1 hypothetical protein CNEO3_1340003 [Clostridium neonatale]CAI3570639.1 hypothetical protein CNEO3_1240003 [Clostridium neonatale]CAI3571276.1 hypothetical protein CNEO4_190026 [Clostridium neonatale]